MGTAEGSKPIETLQVGDLVLARDENTGETAYKPITHLFINNHMTVWSVDVVDVGGIVETHHVTNNHPYAVVGAGWVQAADLQPGMVLETEDGSPVTVLRVQDTGVIERTYNLEVADFHTFFVGQRFVLVHNECKVPDLNVNKAVRGPEVGGGGTLEKLSPNEIRRIQNAANRTQTEIHVVGSRVNPNKALRLDSDYDYVVNANRRTRGSLKGSLPGAKDGREGTAATLDVFKDPLDRSRPHVTFFPQ